MEFGRFIHVEDFDDVPNLLSMIEDTLSSIIVPEFTTLGSGDQFYFDDVENFENNNLLFLFRINSFVSKIEADKDIGSGDFITNYIAIKDIAMSNIIAKMSPVVKRDYFQNDQFLIKLVNIKFIPEIRVYVDSSVSFGKINNDYGDLIGEIYIELTINVEDISELEPGEFEASKIKFNNLCSSYSIHAIIELKEWAKQLGLPDNLTKEGLCEAIKYHYGF